MTKCSQVSRIRREFPPIIEPHVLYTVKKYLKFFQNIFSYSRFDILKLFLSGKTF
jgi:hypothetical protein